MMETEAKLEEAQSEVDEALLKINQELDDIRFQLAHADRLGLSEAQKIELRHKQEELEHHKQEIQDYQRDVLNPIRKRMDDEDNPPDKSDLRKFRNQIDSQRPQYLESFIDTQKHTRASVSSEIIGKPKVRTIELCKDFCMAHDDKNIEKSLVQDELNFAPLKL
ncbi:MAG: hypothetical protein AAF988_04910 [Pseudomonadota bacterium]